MDEEIKSKSDLGLLMEAIARILERLSFRNDYDDMLIDELRRRLVDL